MRFKFVAMNLEYARRMIDNWKYNDEYYIYDYSHEKELMLNTDNWGIGMFAVLNEEDNLVGEVNIEFYKEDKEVENGGYVEYEVVKNNPENVYEMWIGWGLKPELCGKGLGKEFVSQCIQFAVKEHDYKGEFVRCGVASFNKRAIKVYQKVGFETFLEREFVIDNKKQKIFQMKKKIK